jgi:putative FmdB family regulatory protein
MPVYEFYCSDCHTIFNFLSRRVNTDKRPDCPRCGRSQLERQVSQFAFSRGRTEEPVEGMPDLDEARMEQAIQSMAGEMEGLDENDPRQMARFMRKLTEATGMSLGTGLEEAMRRLESGEDLEKIEDEMGDLFDGENPFSREGMKGLKKKFIPPSHDDTLYTF